MKRIHFHSIDALRFFAFLKVYLLHLPIHSEFPIFSYLKSGGGIGVSFFFVLSGFLITYLLCMEKLYTGTLNMKKFMVRRALRIWPLFYVMVIIAFVLPYDFKQAIGMHMVGGGYDLDWRFSFTFLENYKMLIMDNFPKTTPLPVFWSLCIEEHFYIFWMLVLFIIPSKYILHFLVSGFFIAWISKFAEPFFITNDSMYAVGLFTNMDYFASGGLLGFFVASDYAKVSSLVQSIPNWVKRLFIILVVLFVVFQKEILVIPVGSVFRGLQSSIIAILFTLLIAIFVPTNSSIRIKSHILSFLGIRSYGLYVYHIIFIHTGLQYCDTHGIRIDNWLILSLFILGTLGGSVVVSSISFKYFEKPLLSLRDRTGIMKWVE